MSIESPADLAGMKAVSQVVRLTLDALVRQVRPGVTTGELDAAAAKLLAAHGARSAPALVYGFPGTVLISINDEVVHGIPGARVIARRRSGQDRRDGREGRLRRRRGSHGRRRAGVEPGRATGGLCERGVWRGRCSVARAGAKVNEIGRAVEREVRRRGFTVVARTRRTRRGADHSRAAVGAERVRPLSA